MIVGFKDLSSKQNTDQQNSQQKKISVDPAQDKSSRAKDDSAGKNR
jgi:hypothetical protein